MRFLFNSLLVSGVLLIAACSQSPNSISSPTVAAVQPSEVPVTLTTVAPTATNMLIQATAVLATAVPTTVAVTPTLPTDSTISTVTPTITAAQLTATNIVSDTIWAALVKQKTLKTYRGESSIILNDNLELEWKGDVQVPDAYRFTYSDRSVKNAQMIKVGDKAYLKNQSASGSPEWFLIPESEGSNYPNLSPRVALVELIGDMSSYQKDGSAELDGLQCVVYLQDKRAVAGLALRMFMRFDGSVSEEDAALLEKAEQKLWICLDGYPHQIQTIVRFKPVGAQTTGAGFEIFSHIYDFDADLKIDVPRNVAPLPGPTTTP